jgi:tetratricopeptide (TPR) repeat protein
LYQRIGDRPAEAYLTLGVGNAFLRVPVLRDLNQAERWYRRSLSLTDDADRLGRASCLTSLGGVALQRFLDARAADQPEPILLDYLNAALRDYRQALSLTPVGDHETCAVIKNDLGIIYRAAGDTRRALRHYQQSIQHNETHRNIYGAGQARYNVAVLLHDDGRVGEALLYARAALGNFRQAGGADDMVSLAEQLIARLEQHGKQVPS